MYAQNNYYQQNGTSVTTQQPGLAWNGSSWVPAANVNSSTYSTYAANASNYTNKPNSHLVQTYTQFYHAWHAMATEQEEVSQKLQQGPAKDESLRQAQWYKYYADLSSAAAHHYNNNPYGVAPPAQLPPAPPTSTSTPTIAAAQQSAPTSSQTPAQQQQELPDSLKRYVHQSLQQCSTKEEIQAMQKSVETTIKQALQNGTMYSTNWEARPLLAIERKTSNYYGPSLATSISTAGTIQATGGTAAAVKAFRNSEIQDTRGAAVAVKALKIAASQGGGGNAAAVKALKTSSAASNGYFGPSTSYNGLDKRSPSSEHGDAKKKSKKKKKDKYEASLVENDRYYESAMDLGENDFLSLSPETSKKTKKRKAPGTNDSAGFERSSSALAKRAHRFAGVGGISTAAEVPVAAGASMKRYMGLALIGGSKKLDEADYEHMKVKGTCTKLEKEYLRLTAPPRAELVRPQPFLSKHLDNLKAEWSASKRRDYSWFCSQLKAVRQDLTVQRIMNAFAADVYETHARIALEEGDLNEYNQCQTQLKELYDTLHDDNRATKNQNEFIAYRLIYYIFLTGNKKYKEGSSDLFKIMLSLTPEQRNDPCISHALKVRAAVAAFDYHAFFRLQRCCPKHGTYLISLMVPKVRHWALERICKAYRPSVSTRHVLEELGFDSVKEMSHGKQWLESSGVILSESRNEVLTKESVVRESDLIEKKSSLI